ncbi:MAG: hypothetical protein WAU47_00205 [Desulfobaccales bacterium]
MKITLKTCLVGLILVLALAGLALAQGMQPAMITGTHWKEASPEMKTAYLRGVGNMADFEVAVMGKQRAGCLSLGLVNELKGKSIESLSKEVDKFYKDNPDKMNTPVVEALLRQCTALCKPGGAAAPKKK